ncbi:uncharacterized protein TNCV_52971 [Trichonephila clavipes]|nr:uncharacterized protein TNCV_52971 [Trichonephila clavipes]
MCEKLLTYTLSEYVMAEVDRLPEIDSFYYDVDSPHGLHELFDSLSAITHSVREWEVGIAEIFYPHTWYNINEKNNIFGFDLGDGKLITRKLPPGYYESIPDILRSMTLPSHEGKISFKFNANDKRVKIKTQNDARVVLEAGLCDVLGFHSQIVKGIEESAFVADPQAAFPVFYVYSDIVQPVVVGHVEALL